MLLDTFRVTRETIAGVWITRALRAVPALAEVRLESHAAVTRAQTELLREAYPHASPDELRLVSRVTVELLYAAVEMLFDEPPLDTAAVAQIVSTMVASYLAHLQGSAAPPVRARKPRAP